MAVQHDTNGKDDLKTQFITREGTYRLMTLSEYSRPSRVGYQSNQNSPQVRVSIVSLPTTGPVLGQNSSTQTVQQQIPTTSSSINNGQDPINSIQGGDRICFNYGKEIFVYAYRGIKKAADLSKQIDKKIYKGTNPSCHDFNAACATLDGAPLLVGFTTGQIQLVQPGRREPGKLYNEERLIDKTKVTCLKWLPGSTNLFLASHASGHLYLYNEELPCTPTAPTYQPFKIGDGYTILTCKTKSTRNPLYKWTFGSDNLSINEFSFSPCGSNLAVVSQDGFLRVFHYDTMELIGLARSYFGGFLCVCWSPDGKYIVVGGEDDLVTVWSLNDKRVVARGQGHRSWVSVVAFDPFTTSYSNWEGPDFSDDENTMNISENYNNHSNYDDRNGDVKTRRPLSSCTDKLATSYRLGSVSQDTQLCLWDITEDVLRQPINFRHRLSSHDPHPNNTNETKPQSPKNGTKNIDNSSNKLNSLKKNSNISSGSNVNEAVGSSVRGFYNIGDSADMTVAEKSVANNLTTTKVNTVNNLENNKNTLMGNNNSKIKNKTDSQIGNCIGNNLIKIDSPDSSTNTITKISTSSKSSDSSITSSVGCGSGGVGSSGIGGGGGGGGGGGTGGGGGGSGSGISAFNTLTQKLSNFSFGSDKNKTPQSDSSSSSLSFSQNHNHHNNNHNNNKKMFLLSSKSNNYNINNLNNNINSSSIDNSTIDKNNSKNLLTTFDPMRLIGTSACPRFDECPVLEPLVCKKIAHERLTALIFREDCFLTACQDGFIYTWARPGSVNHPQHMALNPSSQPQNSAAV